MFFRVRVFGLVYFLNNLFHLIDKYLCISLQFGFNFTYSYKKENLCLYSRLAYIQLSYVIVPLLFKSRYETVGVIQVLFDGMITSFNLRRFY